VLQFLFLFLIVEASLNCSRVLIGCLNVMRLKLNFWFVKFNLIEFYLCVINMEIELCSNDFIFESKLGWISTSVWDPLLEPLKGSCALKTVSSLGKESSYNLETLECLRGACDCWNNFKMVMMIWPLELVRIVVHFWSNPIQDEEPRSSSSGLSTLINQ